MNNAPLKGRVLAVEAGAQFRGPAKIADLDPNMQNEHEQRLTPCA